MELERGYTGGYTPALTLGGLFMQFLSFFASSKVEQDYGGDPVDIGDQYVTVFVSKWEFVESMLADGWDMSAMMDSFAAMQPMRQRLWDSDITLEVPVQTSYSAGNNSQVQMVAKSGAAVEIYKLSRRNPRFEQTHQRIKHWRCPKTCGYGTTLPHLVDDPHSALTRGRLPPSHPALVPPPECLFPRLDIDTAHYLCSRLPNESLLSLAAAYPPFYQLMNEAHIMLRRELRCFFLRTPMTKCILGIGISFDNVGKGLSSEFDWLSQEAFEDYDVRKTIRKTWFEHFLPLALSKEHFARAQPAIWQNLIKIDDAFIQRNQRSRPGPGRPTRLLQRSSQFESIRVIYRLMTSIVVSLMKSCDDHFSRTQSSTGFSRSPTLLHASEKAVTSYCQLYHVMIQLSRAHPEILYSSIRQLRAFIDSPQNRNKEKVPDMGELMVQALLVFGSPLAENNGEPALRWTTDLNGPFLHEILVRNVRWVLQAAPELEALEPASSAAGGEYRLAQTFDHSKTSLRLVMFQATFVRIFVTAHLANPSQLLDSETYGFPTPPAAGSNEPSFPERMVSEIKAIYAVKTWSMFFDKVGFTKGREWGKVRFCQELRNCLVESEKRGYHRRSNATMMMDLRQARMQKERHFARLNALPVAEVEVNL